LDVEGQIHLGGRFRFEGRNHLPNRHILFGVVTLLPPDDEVGGAGACRRERERGGEEDGSDLHGAVPRSARRASMYLPAGDGNGRAGAMPIMRPTDPYRKRPVSYLPKTTVFETG
jgi:hypothetical protein